MSKKIHDSVLELIGNTPMVRLNKIGKGLASEILVKLEYLNPSGSLKDRIALEMIEQAEKAGKIKPDHRVEHRQHGLCPVEHRHAEGLQGHHLRDHARQGRRGKIEDDEERGGRGAADGAGGH